MYYKYIQTFEDHSDLLKTGKFWELFPELTGTWERDKLIILGQPMIQRKTVTPELNAIWDAVELCANNAPDWARDFIKEQATTHAKHMMELRENANIHVEQRKRENRKKHILKLIEAMRDCGDITNGDLGRLCECDCN
jgi:hypothetical protein